MKFSTTSETTAIIVRPVRAKTRQAMNSNDWQCDRTNDLPVWEVNQINSEVQNFRKSWDAVELSHRVFRIGYFFCS